MLPRYAATLLVVFRAFGHVLRIIASQRVLVKDTAVTAAHKAWVIVDASHQRGTITRNWITRIRKELTSQRVRRQGGNIRAFETDNLFRIAANVEKEIRPIAGMSAVIISQSLIASHFLGLAVSATIIVNFASSRGWVETERMFANGRLVAGTRGKIVNTAFTIDVVPVIFAIIVNAAAFSIKEQTILASFESQSSILALVKLVAILGVRIQLQAVRLRA